MASLRPCSLGGVAPEGALSPLYQSVIFLVYHFFCALPRGKQKTFGVQATDLDGPLT